MDSYLYLRIYLILCSFNLIILTYCSSSTQPSCHENESKALLQFKDNFVIDKFASVDPSAYPKLKSWKLLGGKSDGCCSWDGIQCDHNTGHVIGLDLRSSFLHGSINSNSSLFTLVHLRSLNLADNEFKFSEIPSRIGHLARLTSLNLSNSGFCGQIPSEISSLSKLVFLDLSTEIDLFSESLLKLEKPILRDLVQNLTNLKVLDLSAVNISSSVPSVLSNISSLTTLHLERCSLYGEFPMDIFLLPTLQILNAGWNENLTGSLPEFQSNSRLKALTFLSTGFYGNFPADYIRNWNGMKMINKENLTYMHENQTIQYQIRAGPTTHVALSWSQELSYDYSMRVVSKGTDRLYERIQTALVVVDLSSNTFVGDIPESLGSLTGLQLLNISNNKLTGAIPSSLAKLTKLESLDLSQNLLSGQIPWQLTQLTFLSILNVSHNQLTGPIPQGNQFDTFENSSYDGNSELCGFPLSKFCKDSMTSPPPLPMLQGHESDLSRGIFCMVIALGYGSGLVVGLFIGTTLTRRYHEWFVETFGRGKKFQKNQKRIAGRRT